jgi:hypothetical protein
MLCGFLSAGAPFAFASEQASHLAPARIPVLENLGIIPVRWEAGETDQSTLGDGRKFINSNFSAAVRDARRFRVLDNDLVASSWSTPKGRAELIGQFELHAFASLTVSARPDVITLTGRLLGSDLAVLIQESENVQASWIATAGSDEIKEKLESLMFRVFNRIPMDVSVTSVQGAFITVSGGKEQGVHVGDNLEIMRVSVAAKHPADGSWLKFHSEPLGKAKVIEVKRNSSIAKLEALVREGAVTPGDGARIPAISGRAKFARLAETPEFRDGGSSKTIVVPPLYQDGVPQSQPTAERSKRDSVPSLPSGQVTEPTVVSTPANQYPQQTSGESRSGQTVAQPTNAPRNDDKKAEDKKDDDSPLTVAGVVRSVADDITFKAGAQTWSLSGPVSDSGKFPLWLFNTIGADVTRTLMPNLKLTWGGHLGFGQTTKSSYLAYSAGAKIFFEADFPMLRPLIKTWRAGGLGQLSGLSVPEGVFGGGDFLKSGGFAGLAGEINVGTALGESFDWFAEFALMPMNIGRLGYSQKMSTIESAMGWSLTLGAFKPANPDEIEWGGLFGWTSEKMTLANNGRPEMSWMQLMALARWELQ